MDGTFSITIGREAAVHLDRHIFGFGQKGKTLMWILLALVVAMASLGLGLWVEFSYPGLGGVLAMVAGLLVGSIASLVFAALVAYEIEELRCSSPSSLSRKGRWALHLILWIEATTQAIMRCYRQLIARWQGTSIYARLQHGWNSAAVVKTRRLLVLVGRVLDTALTVVFTVAIYWPLKAMWIAIWQTIKSVPLIPQVAELLVVVNILTAVTVGTFYVLTGIAVPWVFIGFGWQFYLIPVITLGVADESRQDRLFAITVAWLMFCGWLGFTLWMPRWQELAVSFPVATGTELESSAVFFLVTVSAVASVSWILRRIYANGVGKKTQSSQESSAK